LAAAAEPPVHEVMRLLPEGGRDEDVLRLEIDSNPVTMKLSVRRLSERLVTDLPDRALDLLEIAAVVYGADAAVSRGGSADRQMGAKWHRRFLVTIPVRDVAFWTGAGVRQTLEETLMFLTGDRFVFCFTEAPPGSGPRSPFFKFDKDSAWQATRVLMFSGGLDSFAGTLEEIAEQRQHVAIVSHFSATKIAPVQQGLQRALAKKFGENACQHVPVQVQMMGRALKEGTHRSRSFLFATLGAISAEAFGLNRVSFHENGVVSLNLPPVGNVLGTRATRTTHPQTLTRFTDLLGRVFAGGMKIDNPFFWRTKKDVVDAVARLNMADQIAFTRSCADVHNQTTQHPHCGRCSQCIDRRVAVLAAGLARYDPAEAYRVDLLDGARSGVVDREIALSYLRNAQAFEHMTKEDLERHFPAVLDAVNHLQQPPDTALSMIRDLLARHGSGVAGAMRAITRQRSPDDFPENSLPRLYGEVQRQVLLPAVDAAPSHHSDLDVLKVEIDGAERRVTIGSHVTFHRNATADLLIVLAEEWLSGAGQGLDPLDFPLIKTTDLAQRLKVADDEAVRRRVLNARRLLKQRFASAGLDPDMGAGMIENIPWQGYRLSPDRVSVRKRAADA
jgi:7-cyano-7-deazaguanine synthase in queuosine biosynthesis